MVLPTEVVFVVVSLGLLGSAFYGIKATEIFGVSKQGKSRAWKIHQFWLNFAGSIVGWITLWFLARKAYICFGGSCPISFGFWDAAAVFVTFIGITGYLPVTVVGVIQGVKELAVKMLGMPK